MNGKSYRWILCICAILLVILPLLLLHYSLGIFIMHLLILFFIYSVLGISWNFVGGFAGRISFGHAAFFGTGAYTVALLTRQGINGFLTLPLGAIMAAILSLPIGFISIRLLGPFFLIATLGIGEICRLIALNLKITGGALGIILPMTASYSKLSFYYFSVIIFISALVLSYKIRKSRVGLALFSIREDYDAAQVIGINPTKYLTLIFVLSCFLAGLSGGIKGLYDMYIEPNSTFSFSVSVSAVLISVIGGIGTTLGPVIGAMFFTFLQEVFLSSFPTAHLLVYGLLVIMVVLFEPSGIMGLISKMAKKTR